MRTRMRDRSKSPAGAWVSEAQERHDSTLRGFIRRRVRRKEDVCDITQEVYLRLLRVEDPDAIREPLALIYRIATNVLHDLGRRTKRERVDFDSDATTRQLDQLAVIANGSDDLCAEDALVAAFDDLPDNYRTILLHKARGRSDEEISRALGLTPGTVRIYRQRAIARLLEACALRPGRTNGNGKRR
jgi:RNA polymerase sigma factor (sigma-70 family)